MSLGEIEHALLSTSSVKKLPTFVRFPRDDALGTRSFCDADYLWVGTSSARLVPGSM